MTSFDSDWRDGFLNCTGGGGSGGNGSSSPLVLLPTLLVDDVRLCGRSVTNGLLLVGLGVVRGFGDTDAGF
jgi:hypothetical protein